jgi:hydrogenase-4 component F
MTTGYLLLPLITPLVAASAVALLGWRRPTAWALAAAGAVILACGIALAAELDGVPRLAVGHILRADPLTATMLIVIGAVGTLSCLASIGYIDAELSHGHTTARGARHYGVLLGIFLAAMSLAVVANNLGVVWVAIEATTVATAFLVGHRGTRTALEATWKYVIICSVGIAFAFLGTVLLYFVGQHAGGGSSALNLDVLLTHAGQLDSSVTRLAAGLLLIGYGTKAGLVPFHTWLADAHSQAPAPVSALMSGVLLAVAFSALLRVKSVIDVALGTGFLRTGLLVVGLLTMLVAAALLVGQRDYKRMLAYSSMENMGLIAVAAAGGTELAIAALLLHVLAHGLGKTVLFVAAGQLQVAHGSTTIADVTGVLGRSRVVGVAFAIGTVVLLGLPPFAMFASELSIARGLTSNHLAWALGVALLFVLISFAALAANAGRLLLGRAGDAAPAIVVPASVTAALVLGVAACVAIGVTAGPLTSLLHDAATAVGAVR